MGTLSASEWSCLVEEDSAEWWRVEEVRDDLDQDEGAEAQAWEVAEAA